MMGRQKDDEVVPGKIRIPNFCIPIPTSAFPPQLLHSNPNFCIPSPNFCIPSPNFCIPVPMRRKIGVYKTQQGYIVRHIPVHFCSKPSRFTRALTLFCRCRYDTSFHQNECAQPPHTLVPQLRATYYRAHIHRAPVHPT